VFDFVSVQSGFNRAVIDEGPQYPCLIALLGSFPFKSRYGASAATQANAIVAGSGLNEKVFSTRPLAAIFPLAFEFSATPPARHRFARTGFFQREPHDRHHRVFRKHPARQSNIFVMIGISDSGTRCAPSSGITFANGVPVTSSRE